MLNGFPEVISLQHLAVVHLFLCLQFCNLWLPELQNIILAIRHIVVINIGPGSRLATAGKAWWLWINNFLLDNNLNPPWAITTGKSSTFPPITIVPVLSLITTFELGDISIFRLSTAAILSNDSPVTPPGNWTWMVAASIAMQYLQKWLIAFDTREAVVKSGSRR